MFNLQVVYIVECSKKLCTEYVFYVFKSARIGGGGCIFCVSGVKSARIGKNPLVSVFQLFQVGRGCVSCFRFCVGAVFRVSGFRGKLCFVFRVLQAETLSGVETRMTMTKKKVMTTRMTNQSDDE